MSRANQIRAAQGRPPFRAHVTPHTFRRTYITYMIAAGYGLPYVQAQVGHADPAVTLSIYAQRAGDAPSRSRPAQGRDPRTARRHAPRVQWRRSTTSSHTTSSRWRRD
ncbi:MAG: tyrosine-type recombinase/integrase [Solirubrobacteraceae bacterium]